jgi:hypothetical protein
MSAKSLKVTFVNNSGYASDQVSIGFPAVAGVLGITTLDGKTTIQSIATDMTTGTWYTLKALEAAGGGLSITSFSGRIYVCYGDPWVPQKVATGAYEPAQAVTDPNLFKRYDKMELTYNGQPADVADLTSIDYWSIPMRLDTFRNDKPKETVCGLRKDTTTQQVFNGLNALTTTPAHNGTPSVTPIPALVPGQFTQYGSGPKPGTTFARIIGPSSYPPLFPAPGVPVSPYPTFAKYLGYLSTTFGPGTTVGATIPGLGGGTIATIAGSFAGVGPNVPATGPQSPQTYALTATIDAGGNITLSGTLTPKSGSAAPLKMEFKSDDLNNPAGIYGGNASYSVNGGGSTTPQNDVYGWISADLFAGLNIGAVGSATVIGGTAVGAMSSSEWFKLKPDQFFAHLQPSASYYNQWAATLQPLSEAYNFAYSDRFAPVLVSLNPDTVETLQITLQPAAVTMPSATMA